MIAQLLPTSSVIMLIYFEVESCKVNIAFGRDRKVNIQ